VETKDPISVRCSALVLQGDSVLLVQRRRSGTDDYVLPGGTPRRAESMGSCVRREVAEETGLQVNVERVAFVLESRGHTQEAFTLDLVFTASVVDARQRPEAHEPGLRPAFHPLDELAGLPMRPPIAGHIRALASGGRGGTGVYLGNLWRPTPRAPAQGGG
jgi:8-oxo-dGTP diphosphatase